MVKTSYAPLAAMAFLISLAGAQSAIAAPILNENFDELSPQLSVTSVGAFSAIDGTNVDVVTNTSGYGPLCAGPESGSCIDLAGTSGNPNGILQSNNMFGPGQYLLSFDLVGSGRDQTDLTNVTFGNYDQNFTLTSDDITDGIVLNALVTLNSSGFLTFSENPLGGNGNIGNLLDNVSVSAVAVPEPVTLSLFGTGLVGAAMMRRRKKKTA